MFTEDSHLNTFLINSNLISKADLETAQKEAKERGMRLRDYLVVTGKVTADNLRKMEGYALGIPFVTLSSQKIPFEILSLIPEPLSRRHNVIAFKRDDGVLEVALLDLEDLQALNFLEKKQSLKILPRFTDLESIRNSLVRYQKNLKEHFGDVILKASASLLNHEDVLKKAEDPSAIHMVDTLLQHAIVQQATDIHIEPLENEFLIRYRIDGLLHDAMVLPKSAEAAIIARIKFLANVKVGEKSMPQDGRFKVEMNHEKLSLRVSVMPTESGEKIVIRILRESVAGFTLEYVGFHGESLERMHDAIRATRGMILTAGPADSGKTTTLYTLLDILHRPDVTISTIEDPVGYRLKRIHQTQIKPSIGLTFPIALQSVMKQDPDIVMVGEIRDTETASLALNAALNRSLVLSALPLGNASQALSRLLDIGLEPFLVASAVHVVVGQRLVRRLLDTREKYLPSKQELSQLSKIADLDAVLKALKTEKIVKAKDDWSKVSFYRAIPSKHNDGYKGRIGLQEVLKMTPTMKELIQKKTKAGDIEAQARKEGMLTIIEDGIVKAAIGLTSIQEIFRLAEQLSGDIS